MEFKKIKLFTHNDEDGVSCGILGKLAFKEIDIEYCGYGEIDEKIQNYLKSDENTLDVFIFITDISVNKETADLINELYIAENAKEKLLLLDHHKTALWLNEYNWANVTVHRTYQPDKHILESGTSLFYEYLLNYNLLNNNQLNISIFVDLVRAYDTWEWSKTDNLKAKMLNDVFKIIGKDDFVKEYTIALRTGDPFIFDIKTDHKILLTYFNKKNNEYIDNKMKNVVIDLDDYGNKVGYVICDNIDCTSMLGNKMCEDLEIDYACLYYDKGCALRSIGNFDVSEIAKQYDGGGHKNAAGYTCDNLNKLINLNKAER
jgi:oligoribonuclease NrnB/cAMP/cGMP phosphodiesterase (DHH superfamily)